MEDGQPKDDGSGSAGTPEEPKTFPDKEESEHKSGDNNEENENMEGGSLPSLALLNSLRRQPYYQEHQQTECGSLGRSNQNEDLGQGPQYCKFDSRAEHIESFLEMASQDVTFGYSQDDADAPPEASFEDLN